MATAAPQPASASGGAAAALRSGGAIARPSYKAPSPPSQTETAESSGVKKPVIVRPGSATVADAPSTSAGGRKIVRPKPRTATSDAPEEAGESKRPGLKPRPTPKRGKR